jgi:hypothetical protein
MAQEKPKYAHGKHPNSLANLNRRWKPGQSGNPNGRPKGIKYISEALRDLLASDEKLADELARNLANRAKKSDSAINIIFERTEGKVTLPIGGDPNMPLVVEKIVAHVTKENNGSSPGS